jgi:large conductance mechanosensitive channel
MIGEFKEFAMRGNVIDMAVGIVIGGAFGKIVSSFVSDVVMPPIGVITGGVDFSEIRIPLGKATTDPATGDAVEAVSINIGAFTNTVIDFVIIAFAIFMVIKLMNKAKKKEAAAPAAPPEPSKEEILLAEIRDAIRAK